MRPKFRRLSPKEVGLLALILALVFVVMQFLPLGAPRTNPPVVAEPPWDSPETRTLFVRACADCHSNQTRWPWYAQVAPASWLVASDVAEGREHMNVSEWNRPQKDAHKAANEVREGEMPIAMYRVAHSEARLDAAERARLIAGLVATFGDKKPGEREGDDD